MTLHASTKVIPIPGGEEASKFVAYTLVVAVRLYGESRYHLS